MLLFFVCGTNCDCHPVKQVKPTGRLPMGSLCALCVQHIFHSHPVDRANGHSGFSKYAYLEYVVPRLGRPARCATRSDLEGILASGRAHRSSRTWMSLDDFKLNFSTREIVKTVINVMVQLFKQVIRVCLVKETQSQAFCSSIDIWCKNRYATV